MATQLNCANRERAKLVKRSDNFNGIDYIEVIPPQTAGDIPLLLVFCFKAVQLNQSNIRIEGGVRTKNIGVLWAQTYPGITQAISLNEQTSISQEIDQSQRGKVLVIRPTSDGDFSTYTLKLVDSVSPESPPPNFDPVLSKLDFSFKVDCPTDFDCNRQAVCPPENPQEPVIDYMTKDYESFRQLMLDRLSVTMPDWRERNPADIGVALVELLAYVGDQLSYYQDAVATEAYLGTARKRISIRRHARLLDYPIHDGCNARAWISMTVDASVDGLVVPKGTQLLTGVKGVTTVVRQEDFDTASMGATIFESMQDLTLYSARNRIELYSWGEPRCCLPAGATGATLSNAENALDFQVFSWENVPGSDSDALKGFLAKTYNLCWISNLDFIKVGANELVISDGVNSLTITLVQNTTKVTVMVNGNQIDEFVAKQQDGALNLYSHRLRIGDVLIFEEARSPTTGKDVDADPSHRHAVRLTQVSADLDSLTTTSVLNIAWSQDDALPFPLCLQEVMDPQTKEPEPVSVVYGNVVLADHGHTRLTSKLSVEPYSYIDDHGHTMFTEFLGDVPPAEHFYPRLSNIPLTFSAPFDPSKPASEAFNYNPRDALPAIVILGDEQLWSPKRDLLSSDQFATDFVVEVDNDKEAYVRFGDNELGRRPRGSTIQSPNHFFAVYRVGNGRQGNVGCEKISRIVNSDSFNGNGILTIRNPMEGRGGADFEAAEDVRQFAPLAFRAQERAVTEEDYVKILQRHPQVQKASAALRWTGSWYTVFIAVDRLGGQLVDDAFKKDILKFLNKYRLAGYDLEIVDPTYVSLDISIKVCMAANYLWGDVEKGLIDVFSNRILPDGSRGFFHPDNFTFGDPVYKSRVIDTAMKVAGVTSVIVDRFQLLGKVDQHELVKGEIKMAPSEIARLDNDPNFPENGKIRFSQEGDL